MTTGALLRMLVVLEPDRDWTLLGQVYKHLKRTATPSRDKLSRMVPATDLLALGIRLMKTCQSGPPQRVTRSQSRPISWAIPTCRPPNDITSRRSACRHMRESGR